MLERRVEVLRPSCTYRLPLRLASDAVSLLVLSSFFFGVLPHDLTASHGVCPAVSLWHNLATVRECACLLAFPAPRWPIFKLHAADLCNTLNAHYCNVHMRLPRAPFSTTTLRITNGKASQPTTTSVQTLPQPYRSVNAACRAACRSACRAARCYAVHAVVTADDDGNLSAHSAITRLGQRKP